MDEPNERLRQLIAERIPCEEILVEGDGVHFSALIVSAKFAGLNRVKRHQLVYQALGSSMDGEIHALSMRTLTPEERSERGG